MRDRLIPIIDKEKQKDVDLEKSVALIRAADQGDLRRADCIKSANSSELSLQAELNFHLSSCLQIPSARPDVSARAEADPEFARHLTPREPSA